MPNLLTPAGLQLKTQAELVAELTAAYQSIYGSDIELASDTPDGQMMMIYVQMQMDMQDLLASIYNSFNPDAAIGVTLDARCAINGVARLGGTYTLTNVNVTVDRPTVLDGLDTEALSPDGVGYTIADNIGTQWVLVDSVTLPAPGIYPLVFRARNSGPVSSAPFTITVPIDIVLGVTALANPSIYSVLGLAEETDAGLRLRRQKSVALSSQGYLNGLIAALLNITGVEAAAVYENTTGATDGDGVPGHSIWCILNGGASAEIADVIYKKRNAGCGLKGSTSVPITQVDGTTFDVLFDYAASEAYFQKFNLTSYDGFVISTAVQNDIKAQIVARFRPGVHETININQLATLIQSLYPSVVIYDAGFCLTFGGTYTNALTPTTKAKYFVATTGNIAITVV